MGDREGIEGAIKVEYVSIVFVLHCGCCVDDIVRAQD